MSMLLNIQMYQLAFLVFCVQACMIQTAFSQPCGCNQYSSVLSSQSCGSYGGTGAGQVGVSGNIDACGTTCVVGSVPVLGSVDFGGKVPATGSVSISGKCSCDCQCEQIFSNPSALKCNYKPSVSSSVKSVSAVQQPTPDISKTSVRTSSNLKAPRASITAPISIKSSTTKPGVSASALCIRKAPSSQSAPNRRSSSTKIKSTTNRSDTPRPCLNTPSVSSPSVTLGKSAPSLNQRSITPSVSKSAPSLSQSSVIASSISKSAPSISKPRSAGIRNLSVSSGKAPSLQKSPSCGSYGGCGTGQVGASGNIDASGSTCVTGTVPIIGSVEFNGCSPTCGSVTISAQCECECK